MQSRLNYYWRLLATGLSFILFALGGALLSILLLSVTYLAPVGHFRKAASIRWMISFSFRFFIAYLRGMGLISYEIHGRENIKPRGQLLIANHPSLLDVVFLISLIKQADCVVREDLCRSVLTGGPVRAARYIRSDSEQIALESVQSLNEGNSLIIFPEGTRSNPGQPLKFHRGASHIALMAKKNITPVLIRCQPATLLKNEKWYHIADQAPHFTLMIFPEMPIDAYLCSDEMQSKKARALNRTLESFFSERLASPYPSHPLSPCGTQIPR